MATLEQRLREIIARLGRFDIGFDRKAHFFRDLGMQSTRALELLMDIEDAFAIAVPDEEYNKVRHFDDLLALVARFTGTPERA